MKMNSQYWMSEGTHVCTIVDCSSGEHNNEAKNRYLRFLLQNAKMRYCNKSFVITDKALPAIRSFVRAAGVKLPSAQVPGENDLIGKQIEIDVIMNEDGYPVAQRWRRPSEDGKDGPNNDDETLF